MLREIGTNFSDDGSPHENKLKISLVSSFLRMSYFVIYFYAGQ